MDRPIVLFRRKFSESSPDLVRKLRHRIKGDVQNTSFRHFHKFSISFPALHLFPADFKQQYIISVCDLDMKNDLKTAKVINWCDGVKNLYPISTTADGNCLLHAVSLSLWGIEDSDQFLRTMLYLTLSEGDASLSNGMSNKIQQRWKYSQDELKKLHPSEFNYDVTSMDISVDWHNIVRAASDIVEPGRSQAGTPYSTLEGVHIFTLANILKRPIIVLAERTARSVYGSSMQENSLFGIYLPMEIPPSDICKTPIVLGYSMNHFAPMVTQADSPDGQGSSQNILPLVMEDYTNLPIRFLLREEELKAGDVIKRYMHVRNIPTVSESILPIPGVVLQHLSIHDDLDIVRVHRRECEQIFMNLGVSNMQPTVGGKPFVAASERVPVSSARTVIPGAPQARFDPVQRTNMPVSTPTRRNTQPCVTQGCHMFGSPETGNMCSSCFNKYTIEFNKQEAQKKGWNVPSEPSAPPMSFHGQESYTDLSVMGETCQNPKCGNRCSVHTFPFCHTCKPTPQKSGPVQPGAGVLAPSNPPVMEVKCINPKCDNMCTASEPVCHECKDFLIQQGAYMATVQPSTTTTNTHGLPLASTSQQNIEVQPPAGNDISIMPDQQCRNHVRCTNLCTKSTFPFCLACSPMKQGGDNSSPPNMTSHPQGSYVTNRTGSSLPPATQIAEPVEQTQGAEGIDENSMFGEGIATAPVKELGKLEIAPSALSVAEFEENSLSSNFHFSHEPSSQTHVINNYKASTSSEGTPSPMESGKRPIYPGSSGQQQATVQSSGSSYAIINEESNNQEIHGNTIQGQGLVQSRRSPDLLKQLCSKPGCRGARLSNNFGYCLDCWTACIRGLESPQEPSPVESTEESRAPLLNTAEIRSITQIATSSKDKKDCASPLCHKKVYPPHKLCDGCIEVLRQGHTRSLEEQTSPRHERKGKSYSPSRPKCKKANCEFHGSSKTGGYCSQCYKEVTNQTFPIASNFKQTPTLSNLPPRTHSDPELFQSGASYTPQVVQSGARYPPQVAQSGVGYPPQVSQSGVGYSPQVVQGGAGYSSQVAQPGGYNQQVTQSGAGYNPQVTQGGRVHIKGQIPSQRCLEPGCDKYGDPNMYFRCTEHYEMTNMSEYQPQPPPANQYNAGEVMHYNVAEKQPWQPPAVYPTQRPPNGGYMNNLSRPPPNDNPNAPVTYSQNSAFRSAMSNVENNMRNRVLCKTTGCKNIGSGMRKGYCSECYPYTLQRRGNDEELPPDDPRMNYGCC
ncbi:uncharacterized protein [Argopecten irradians]|uniref:uncharacterized protein isoform X1 n=1 Tax=Argopecten irradians TaxID=31199 RepID=UPI00371F2CFD